MRYVNIVLTTDKLIYLAPAWSVKSGDVVGVTTRGGEKVLKTVEAVISEEDGGEVMAFLEKMVGREIKKVDARYPFAEVLWPEEVKADVQE